MRGPDDQGGHRDGVHPNNMNRKMAFGPAGHGNSSFTLSEDAGSIGYSIDNPRSATRPRLSFPGKPRPLPGLPGPFPSLPLFSASSFESSDHVQPPSHTSAAPPPPTGRHKGQFLYTFSLSHATFLYRPAVTPVHLTLAPWPLPDTDLSHRFSRALPCRTCSPLPLQISRARFHSSPWRWRRYRPLKRR
jgi:hypothetical protein